MEQSAEPAGGTAIPITPGLLPGSRAEVSTPNRSAQIVLFCGFAADHQFATETTHIGGTARVAMPSTDHGA